MDSRTEKKLKIEKNAMRISFAGSVFFAVAETIMAFVTGSHTIVMDMIFDVVDLILIGPLLLLIPLLYKPVTEKKPYGYGQVESLFMIIKYGVLLAVSVQMILANINLIMSGGHVVDAGDIASFEIFVSAVCLIILILLWYFSRKYASMIIRSEMYIWKVDVLSSFAVGIAFMLEFPISGTKYKWLCAYLDPVIAIILTVFLLIEPVKSIFRNLRNMLLFAPPEDIVNEVRDTVEDKLDPFGCSVEFLEVVQTGRKTWVEVYIKPDHEDGIIYVGKLHEARNNIRSELRKRFDQVYVELIPNLPDN
ncbi:MAG: cation transporter [Lachnospiraceae bacterium]|nr:cation transporter [Lachnospiraceae bacterium]